MSKPCLALSPGLGFPSYVLHLDVYLKTVYEMEANFERKSANDPILIIIILIFQYFGRDSSDPRAYYTTLHFT